MGRKCKDYSGEIHGCWKVIERDLNPISKSHETFWICECQNCGNKASVRKTDLDKNPRSCNNCKGELTKTWKIGDKYGLLTIIGQDKNFSSNKNHTYVKVQCDCGSDPFNVRLEHLKGQGRHCTVSCGCLSMSAGELKIKNILEQNNIIFEQEYRIKDFSIFAPFDFAIFDNNKQLIKLIEFDGDQHFRPVDYFGGEEKFKKQQEIDTRKNDYCNTHGIILLRIPYYQINDINLEMLLTESERQKIFGGQNEEQNQILKNDLEKS